MAQAIEDAIAALEKKEGTPVNPTEPTEPTTPGDSGTIDGSTEQGMNSPQTGDNSNTIMWIAVAVLAAGAMTGTVFFARKKKLNNIFMHKKASLKGSLLLLGKKFNGYPNNCLK